MSRGLGHVEHAILSALWLAKIAGNQGKIEYRGGGKEYTYYHGYNIDLPNDVFDLRLTFKYFALQQTLGNKNFKDLMKGSKESDFWELNAREISPALSASFSRSVRSLIKRGFLIREDIERFGPSREIRFVRRIETLSGF